MLNKWVNNYSRDEVLEKIKKYIASPTGFFHIVSLNVENILAALNDWNFFGTVEAAQIRIIDGAGIVVAGRILNIKAGERYPGVELMSDLLELASKRRLRIMLVGGRPKIAEKVAECQKKHGKNNTLPTS